MSANFIVGGGDITGRAIAEQAIIKLGDRERIVLNTIINEHIHSSEPVGSRNVSKVGPLHMSPATIRNIMVDLEEKGYIAQPHTSAGRVPTDLGYRYYIDHLVRYDENKGNLKRELEESLAFRPKNVSTLVKEFSRRIGLATSSIGFVATSNKGVGTVKQIEFTRLMRGGVATLAILITKSGLVKNVLLSIPASVKDSELQQMSNYLTEQLANMSVLELKAKLVAEYENSASQMKSVITALMDTDENVFAGEDGAGSLVLDGALNVLNMPEFQDSEKVRTLLETLEEKKRLSEIFERSMGTKGVQIFIGSEMGVKGTEDLGIVTSTYEHDKHVIGMLGVIGPKRMNYTKAIPVVDYSSHMLADMFRELYGGENGK
ncbi:heat-inducible transcriptional repressor HrcA [Deferribacterales bacterium RsTz2092]|nr:heat-inducible transcription repressor HrcA [Deferribacterales bacterium]